MPARNREQLRAIAREECAREGIDCPDPDNHVILPDGHVGGHAWLIQAIKDALNAAD